MAENVMEKIVALAKRRGFIYPGSELYGGLANTYDYGPVGAELLRNIKNLWWKHFVQIRPDMVGIDGSIISHHKIWEASGHVASFADAMVDCKNCKSRFRADHLIEDELEKLNDDAIKSFVNSYSSSDLTKEELTHLKEVINVYLKTRKVEGLTTKDFDNLIIFFDIKCPVCKSSPSKDNNWTKVRKFNQLFPIQLGLVEGEAGSGYLRGETAQVIFTNFHNVVDSTRVRLPFGIAQLGKSFRNEITPGNSVFRTIEFEQAEIEYFFDHTETKWELLFEEWKQTMYEFVTKELGVKEENLRWRPHTDEERSFYSKRTEDLEYQFPFGFKELWGLAYRTDYDLTQHQEASKKDLTIVDPKTNKKILPHVIEPAVGVNRLLLMVLADAYVEEEKRTVLKIAPKIAPYKVAVFPLLANKEDLVSKAHEVFKLLSPEFMTAFDDRGNIGKRYLAQDEIGTPWCVTIDFDTLDNETVTVRDRDTTQQERIAIKDLSSYFHEKLR
jgi:glycyl-tRNA synthetase